MTLAHAEAELRSCAGTQFDPQAVDALLTEIVTQSVDKAAASASSPTEAVSARDQGT